MVIMEGIDLGYELSAFIPSIGVGLLFWFALRSIIRADRAEREAADAWKREHDTAEPSSESEPPGREHLSGSAQQTRLNG